MPSQKLRNHVITMPQFKTRLALISSLCALLLPTGLPVQAKPAQQTRPSPTTTTIYQRAKEQLPPDLYALYRVIDRVARSNGLDSNPWRVGIASQYEINAFATEVNLIALYNGLLDQLAGDSSALACVVSHEMGHHAKRHIAMGQAQKAALIAQIKEETHREVLAEQQDAKTDATAASVGGSVVQRVIGGTLGNIGGNILGNQGRRRMADSQKRIDEIVATKTKELEQRLAEQVRKQEFEADETGYLYSVRAGFEPEGCLRAMQVLARTPGAEFDTDHPAVPKRIEAFKALMAKYPPQTLAQEGQARISATQPLTYDVSKDGQTLRINSRHGGSAAQDIDRKFGQ
jgi:predicted Zn-dependent protease